MPTEPKPPESLVTLQGWMSQAVTVPPGKDADILNKVPQFITNSSRQSAHERFDIYNNDYWPRCIDSLAEDLPLLYKYWGETVFEEWIIKYLTQYPSKSTTLFYLGRQLYTFLTENYKDNDKDLICNLVAYEWTIAEMYFAKKESVFNPALLTKTQQKTISTSPIYLQPCVSLIIGLGNYDVWKPKQKTPPKLRPIHFVIYQNSQFNVQIEVVPKGLYLILELFQKGSTLETIIESFTEKRIPISEKEVQTWLSHCIKRGWLIHPKKKGSKNDQDTK